MTEIDVWYGAGDCDPCGPIKGILIELNPYGESKIQITDEGWLDNMGWDEEDGDYTYTCNKLPGNYFVHSDDYCWSYPGKCDLNNKWW